MAHKTLKTVVLGMTILSLGAACIHRSRGNSGHTTLPPRRGSGYTDLPASNGAALALGRGYNIIAARPIGPCVKDGNIQTTMGGTGGGGQSTSFDLVQITSREMLRTKLGITAEGSMGIGVYKGDAKVSYYRETSFNENEVFLLINTRVENQTEMLSQYEFADYPLKLLRDKDYEAFTRFCGHEFIASRVTGGDFTAMLRIHTLSKIDHKSVAARLSGGGVGWSAKAALAKELESLGTTHEIEVKILRNGDNMPLPEMKPAELVAYAQRFPEIVKDPAKAMVFQFGTMTYDAVPGYTSTDSNLSTQKTIIRELSRQLDLLLDRRNEHIFILNNPEQYASPDLNKLNSQLTEIEIRINALNANVAMCLENLPALCKIQPAGPMAEYLYPERKDGLCFKLKADPLCGVKGFATGTGKVCGVKETKTGTGEVCGAASYIVKSSTACKEIYRAKKSAKICGVTKHTTCKPHDTDSKDYKGPAEDCSTSVTANTCRNKAFGIEGNESCEDPTHGPATYKTCSHASFGETYRSCEDRSFGVLYLECRRPEFGTEACP